MGDAIPLLSTAGVLALVQAFRFNEREGQDADRFKKALGSVEGRRLTYDELTGKATSD
jgi:hypothetical protein